MKWTDTANYAFLLLNLWAFLLFLYDKMIAGGKRRRVPEKNLWLAAFFGGAIGSLLAMRWLRHKTQHRNFVIGIPLLALLQTAAYLYLRFFRG